MRKHTFTNYRGVRLQMRLDEGEWVIHDPRDGSDAVIRRSNGDPVVEGEFKLARTIASERYPGADIILV